MRAARAAAKGERASFVSQLDALFDEPRGTVLEFVLQAALPLLKVVVDDLCAQEPHQRGKQIALWLLQNAGAPSTVLGELQQWSGLPEAVQAHSVRPPTEPRKDSSASASPKTRAIGRQVCEASQSTAPGHKTSTKGSDNSGDDEDDGADGDDELPPTRFSKHSFVKSPAHSKNFTPRGGTCQARRRASIWKVESELDDDDDCCGSFAEGNDGNDWEAALGLGRVASPAPVSSRAGTPTGLLLRRRFTETFEEEKLDVPPEEEILQLLRNVPQLKDFSEQDLIKISRIAKCMKYEADENLVVHGAVSDRIHIVLDGTGRVSVPHQIGSVKAGDFFGVEALSLASSTSDQQISAFGGPMTTLSFTAADYQALRLRSLLSKATVSHQARKFETEDDFCDDDEDICKETGRAIIRDYEKTASDRFLITEAVQNNKLLGEVLKLDEQQRQLVADSVYLIALPAGEILFSRGDRGKSLFFVHEGLLSVGVDSHLHLKAGDSFGELAILYDTPRNATIVASKDSLLWVLSSESFKLVTRMAYKVRLEEYTEILKGIPCITNGVPLADISMVADVVEEFTVYQGEDVCVEGQDEGLLFTIFKGDCDVFQDGQVLKRITRGDWVGEEQLADGKLADKTVKAVSEVVTVLALERGSFRTVVQAMEQVGRTASVQMASPSANDCSKLEGSRRSSNFRENVNLVKANPFIDHCDKSKQAHSVVHRKLQKMCRKALDRRHGDHDLASMSVVGALGEGSFGCVVLLEEKVTHKHYALKALCKDHIMREKMGTSVQNERSVMGLLDSEFVVRLYSTYQDIDNIFFLLECIEGGELFDLYNDRELFGDLAAAKFYIACVTLGLQHLHVKRVIYRDLKLENCVLDHTGYLKLTDMGIAKVVIGKTYTICGTADYFAPEMLKQVGHNRAVDWWACGVLLFIMATGKSPFDAPEVTQIYKNIVKGFSQVKFPEDLPAEIVDAIKGLCRKKPEERITMQKGGVANFQEMAIFSTIDWETLSRRQLPPCFVPPPMDVAEVRKKRVSRPVVLHSGIEVWDGSLPSEFGC